MFDVEKAQQHYRALAAFAADVDLLASEAQEGEDKELEAIRVLAQRLAKKWRNTISEALYLQQFGNSGAKVEAPAAKAKAGVRVLGEGEEA